MADINLIGGERPLNDALQEYQSAWRKLIAENSLEAFAESVPAVTLSWKVADKKVLFENLIDLSGQTQQVHVATVNSRFIATVILNEPYHGMQVVKILERRSGSDDPLGLDSIDYLTANIAATSDQLAKVSGALLAKEKNENHSWLSLRFGPESKFEAKFLDHLVLKVATQEIAEREHEILKYLGLS